MLLWADNRRSANAYDLNVRRSQILNAPQSAPETSRCCSCLFHESTLTSVSCAATEMAHLPVLTSQMRMVLSTEAEANTSGTMQSSIDGEHDHETRLTCASLGLH